MFRFCFSPKPQVYYAAIVVDLLLRFNWLYSLIPPGHNPLPFIHSSTLPVVITTNVIVCEFLRRTMWGFFRVENEHLNNTEVGGNRGGYERRRETGDVDVRPVVRGGDGEHASPGLWVHILRFVRPK